MSKPFFLAALFICFSFRFLAPAAEMPKQYVCPPCGCTYDDQTFDKPGKCPQCGMALVEKTDKQTSAPTERVTVAVLLYNGAELIDYAGPWEAFGEAGFKVFTVAEKSEPVAAVFGQRSLPDYTFANSPAADILLIPGGGINQALASPALINWVQENSKRSRHVMSVCSGAFILAKAGLLDGLSATTVSHRLEQLAKAGTNIRVVRDQRFVDNGKIITTAGLSSGIDGAFHLIGKIKGKGTAQTVALGMEYNWDPNGKFVRAALADRYLPPLEHIDGEILAYEGDKDHWNASIVFNKPDSAAGILGLLGEQVRHGTPHARGSVNISSPRPDQEMTWTFTDDDGQNWQGNASLERTEQNGKFKVSVKLARAQT